MYTVMEYGEKHLVVMIVSRHETNAEAWRACDRLNDDPISKSEARTDFRVTEKMRSE